MLVRLSEYIPFDLLVLFVFHRPHENDKKKDGTEKWVLKKFFYKF